MRLLSVAALQVSPVVGDPEATLARFERRVRALRRELPGLQLVVAPEHHLPALGGLGDGTPSGDDLAVPVPGPLTDRLAALARDTGLWLVPGSIVERSAAGIHNTAVVLSPDGEVAATYRKCFPWLPYERIVPGRSFVTFDLPGVGRVGLAICHDGAFPEVFRQLAWMGAEVVLQPTLTSTSDRAAEVVLARANAIVNQLYLVNVNVRHRSGSAGRSSSIPRASCASRPAPATRC